MYYEEKNSNAKIIFSQEFKSNEYCHQALCQGLDFAGILNAYSPLDELMSVLTSSARREIKLNALGSYSISIDEHLLMDAVAFWMTNSATYKHQLLTLGLLPLGAARRAERLLINIANIFKDARHTIRRRHLVGNTSKQQVSGFAIEYLSATIH